jgi:hypothetical protein
VQPGPHWALQVLVLVQVTLQLAPHVTEQLVPCSQT